MTDDEVDQRTALYLELRMTHEIGAGDLLDNSIVRSMVDDVFPPILVYDELGRALVVCRLESKVFEVGVAPRFVIIGIAFIVRSTINAMIGFLPLRFIRTVGDDRVIVVGGSRQAGSLSLLFM